MDCAIWLAWQWLAATEVEMRIVWMAVRPQAARPTEFEEIPLRHEFRPGLAPAHSVAVKPPNYRVFSQPHAAADLGGRQPLLKKAIQNLDAVPRLWPAGKRYLYLGQEISPWR